MPDTEDTHQSSFKTNQNNNNNNITNDLDWQRDLQILMDMTEMESKLDIDCQLETNRSKGTSEENVLVPRKARPRPEERLSTTNLKKEKNQMTFTSKLPNQNTKNVDNVQDETNSLLSAHSQTHSETQPCGINKMDLDQKLRILTSILSGLSGKLEMLELDEKEHEVQTEALSVRLNKLEQQVYDLKLDQSDPCSSHEHISLSDNKNGNSRNPSTKEKRNESPEENSLHVQNIGVVEQERKKTPHEIQSQTFYYVTPVSFLDLMEPSD